MQPSPFSPLPGHILSCSSSPFALSLGHVTYSHQCNVIWSDIVSGLCFLLFCSWPDPRREPTGSIRVPEWLHPTLPWKWEVITLSLSKHWVLEGRAGILIYLPTSFPLFIFTCEGMGELDANVNGICGNQYKLHSLLQVLQVTSSNDFISWPFLYPCPTISGILLSMFLDVKPSFFPQ